jgi:hypothetical protein
MGIKNHLLALTHVGPHEHHPAVAQPDMGHLHRDRDPRDHHDLVAPVELVGLTRIVGKRDIGFGCHRPSGLRPGSGIAADGIVTALITNRPKFLEDADQGKPLARRLVRVTLQKLVELLLPRADPRHRLRVAFVDEVGLIRPQDLPHRVPRHMQFTHDLLQGPALHIKGPTDPRDRIHPFNSPSVRCPATDGLTDQQGGQNWTPITLP